MPHRLDQGIEQLKRLNLEIRQRLELAEARVTAANFLLSQLSRTHLLNEQILLGDVVMVRAYSVRRGPSSSGEVVQAALAIPGGYGAVLWDSEELAWLSQECMESDAFSRFLPFDECGLATKAALLPQLESLLDRLLSSLGIH